jgi:hypothetical protein
MTYPFEEFPKIPRLKREVVITEKIDGTNAQIAWVPITSEEHLAEVKADLNALHLVYGPHDGDAPMALYAGSRTRWLNASKEGDNFGFAKWAIQNAIELYKLGPGRHYGEWYGSGIQRNYGLTEKRFALFNVGRWTEETKPACCRIAPILSRGENANPDEALWKLREYGSRIVPGFMKPEGIIVFHSASRQMYKLTLDGDGGKWRAPDVGVL